MTCSLIPHHPKELRSRVVKLHGGTVRQEHIKNPHLPLLEHYSSLSHALRIALFANTSQHEREKKGLFLYSPGFMSENFRDLAGYTLVQPKAEGLKVQKEL